MLLKNYDKNKLNLITDKLFSRIIYDKFDFIGNLKLKNIESSHINCVRMFVKNDITYYIKIADPRFPENHYYSEVLGMNLAKTIGVKVPKIVCKGIYSINPKEKVSFLITEALNGIPLKYFTDLNIVDIYKTIKIISLLHTNMSPNFGVINKIDQGYIKHKDYFQFIEDVFTYALSKNKFEDYKDLRNEIHSLHNIVGNIIFLNQNNFHFSHKDLNVKNILKENSEIRIIDWEWALYLDNETDYAVFLKSIYFNTKNNYLFKLGLNHILKQNICSKDKLFFHIAREIIFQLAFTDIIHKCEFHKYLRMSIKFFKFSIKYHEAN
ncbi:MAG: hypothetical protein IPK88_16845 [Saprospiraceae bacterium]|nr:hypothetical protein [Candidatus Defluviibacterium haderslevense]